jgi:DNA-directed RNA polymerase subunit omega
MTQMLDELKSEKIVNKVGGRFKLAALIQRRMTELLQGSRPLIEDAEGKTMLEIVVQEILQDKITIEGMSVPDRNSASGESPGPASVNDSQQGGS